MSFDAAYTAALTALEAMVAAHDLEVADLQAEVEALKAQLRPRIAWGSSVWRVGTESYADALQRTDRALGGLDVVRVFDGPGDGPTYPVEVGVRDVVYSFKAPPKAVLAGSYDAQFRKFCADAPADRITYWCVNHEPEDDIARGDFTATDFILAFRRLAQIAKPYGAKLKATLILMEWTVDVRSGRSFWNYYPGKDYIDVLGWDAYHLRDRKVADVYARPRFVSAAAGKPYLIAETGVAADQVPAGTTREELLTALAHDAATVEPRPLAVTYFDAPVGHNSKAWPISNSPAAAAAWVRGGL